MPANRSAATRATLVSATGGFLVTVDAIEPGQWALPASDAWTVRQLVAHVVRGMAVISDLLDADLPAGDVLLPDAAAYFRTALDMADVHARIAGRAVTAAAGAGDDVSAWARGVIAVAVARVASTADDEVIVHFAGSLPFVDYLDTRITELVLHTLELQVVCGLEPDAPADALAIVNGILLALADRADPIALALALTGRPGSRACNVLG